MTFPDIPISGSGSADDPYIVPAIGPELEDCRCAAQIRGREHHTIHDLYDPGECPDSCHENRVYVEPGLRFNQFDISAFASAVVSASRKSRRDRTAEVAIVAQWCKLTGLPRRSALMIAAEIHNHPSPVIAIVAPF